MTDTRLRVSPKPVTLLSRIRDRRYCLINQGGALLVTRLWPSIPAERITLVSRFFNVAVNFMLNGVMLWLVIWLLIPRMLGTSAAGMGTLAQAIPATIVALFVFTLGALVGIAQLSINAYGQRAALMLVEDHAVAVTVIRPLILAVFSLVLAGQIPDIGIPSEAVTAGFATLAILTVGIIVQSVALLGGTLLRYTAPITFSDLVVEDVPGHLSVGAVSLVRWKVPMFEEMAKLAIRRGDSAAVTASLQGLRRIAEAYTTAYGSGEAPEVRGMPFPEADPPLTMYGWLGHDLQESLTRIGEDALRQGAPTADSDHTVDSIEDATGGFIRAGLLPEAKRLIEGLILLGCTSHQVGSGYVNQIVRPAPSLVRVMKLSQAYGARYLAAYALTGWALVISYADEHFGGPDQPLGRHPNWWPGLRTMGDAPPFDAAGAILDGAEWQQKWANQMNWSVAFVAFMLAVAKESHPLAISGAPPPPMPTPNEVSALQGADEAQDSPT